MKKKIIIFLILMAAIVYSDTSSSSINWLSKGQADLLYCGIGDCGSSSSSSGGGSTTINYIGTGNTYMGYRYVGTISTAAIYYNRPYTTTTGTSVYENNAFNITFNATLKNLVCGRESGMIQNICGIAINGELSTLRCTLPSTSAYVFCSNETEEINVSKGDTIAFYLNKTNASPMTNPKIQVELSPIVHDICGSSWSFGDIKMSNDTAETGCWKVADGNDATINLTDRFIVGAGANYTLGDTGGEVTHILTIPELPRHQTTFPSSIMTDISYTTGSPAGTGLNPYVKSPITEFKDTVADRGEGEDLPHENRPPYYALVFKQCVCR